MKTPVLTNVHVDNLSPVNTRCSVGWEHGGFRYHYWTTLETKTPAFSQHAPAVLYKNCARNLKIGAPGHFHARTLDPSSKANAAMIREAIRFANERMLWTEAVSDLHKKQAREHADNAERFREHLAKEGGPRLLAAAEAFVKWWHTFEGAQMIAEIRHPDVSEFYAAIEASKTNPKG